jgi:hypothetical protein
MAILVIPAGLVLAGLIFHSIRFRGRRETLYFFLAAAVFGIVRGNIIWLITTVHFEGAFPYVFQNRLLGVYHDSFTADAGWMVSAYIGAFLAFRITDRIPWTHGRVFPFISLACLFIACLSYAVESTAITMGWWNWTLSTKSRIFLDVPLAGIWAWFSIGTDFLLPYVMIRCVRRPGQWWPYLSLLFFPVHCLTHLSNTRVSNLVPIVPYDIYYWFTLLVVLILPFAVDLKMHRPFFPARALGRTQTGKVAPGARPALARSLPFLGLGAVVGVLLVCDLGVNSDPALLIAKIPLAFYTLLAVPAVPPLALLAGAAVLPILGGTFFAAPVVVPLFFFALRGRDVWARAPWLRWAYLVVPIGLTLWFLAWSRDRNEVDLRYWALINSGKALTQTDPDSAAGKLELAIELKPDSLPAREQLVLLSMKEKNLDRAEKILREMLELRPISEDIHANLGSVYLMRGNYDEAERWFRKALSLNPKHAYSREMLANLDRLRRGNPWPEDLPPP